MMFNRRTRSYATRRRTNGRIPSTSTVNKMFDAFHSISNGKAYDKASSDDVSVLCVASLVSTLLILLCSAAGFILFDSSSHNLDDTVIESKMESDGFQRYQEWVKHEHINIKTVDQDLDALLSAVETLYDDASDEYHDHSSFDKQLTRTMDAHCIKELHFKISEEAMSSISSHFEMIIWHLTNNEPMMMGKTDGIDHGFVITKYGAIVDVGDPEISSMSPAMRENVDYGFCSLITELFFKLKEKDLIHWVHGHGDEHDHDEHRYAEKEDMFTDNEYGHGHQHEYGSILEMEWITKFKDLFSMKNLNRDIFALIDASSEVSGHGIKDIHVMVHHLLHNYCSNIFDHFENEWDHITFIESATSHLMQRSNSMFNHNEMPMVDKNGAIIIGDRSIHYDNDHEYETCPFIQKMAAYHYGEMDQQIMNALDALNGDSHSTLIFDERMDVYMEQHCQSMVLSMEESRSYHIDFRNNLWRLIQDLMADRIAKNQHYFVDVTNGDIQSAENGNTKECPFISKMVNLYGTKTVKVAETEIPEYEASSILDVSPLSVYQSAKKILTFGLKDDYANLKRIIEQSLAQFHSADIAKYYRKETEPFQSILQTLSVEMAQYVSDLLNERKETPKHHNVFVMDILSGTVMDVDEKTIHQYLHHEWIQIPFMNTMIDLYYEDTEQDAVNDEMKKKEDDDEMKEKEDDVDSKPAPVSDDFELKNYVRMLWNDIAKSGTDIAGAFDEDIVYGLDTYCKDTMDQLSSFGKRKLRLNVMSMVLVNKEEIEMPVIAAKGDIIALSRVQSGAQFWKCPFVKALTEQLP